VSIFPKKAINSKIPKYSQGSVFIIAKLFIYLFLLQSEIT